MVDDWGVVFFMFSIYFVWSGMENIVFAVSSAWTQVRLFEMLLAISLGLVSRLYALV